MRGASNEEIGARVSLRKLIGRYEIPFKASFPIVGSSGETKSKIKGTGTRLEWGGENRGNKGGESIYRRA